MEDALFYAQLSFSLVGVIFTGTMSVLQPQNTNIYLPIFTSILFAWIPSPMSSKGIQPQLQTLRTRVQTLEHNSNTVLRIQPPITQSLFPSSTPDQ